jgi:H+-transporting ATPase
MCAFGWFVTAIPWTVIGLVWAYMFVWMFVLDEMKLIAYRRTILDTGQPMKIF